jgi:hypothetical protein
VARAGHRRAAAALAVTAAAAGCGGGGLYSYGPYEGSVYHVCSDFRESSPAEDIANLSQHLQRTAERDGRVPPGYHAHLGYLHYVVGDAEAARRHLEAEKRLFPESTTFVDGLLRRIAK